MQLPSAVNLELLQLALNFLQVLTTGEVPPRLLATLTEAQLPLALCNMLLLEPPHPSMARWGGAQRADLQQAVMALLSNLAELAPLRLAAPEVAL